MNFLQIARMTDEEAIIYFEKIRWPEGPICAHCQTQNVTLLQGKSTRPGLYQCNACKKQFTATVGTIMHRSRIPLVKWILAFHLMCASKKGVSAHQLHRVLNITYKSAWFMAHRIRHCMEENLLLAGTVEVDETYIGGKGKGKRGRGSNKKTPVVVLVERDGKAQSKPIANASAAELKGAIRESVDKSSRLMTDEWRSYRGIGEEFDGGHEVIKHKEKVYAIGDVSTNTAECFFSLLKRGFYGTFHYFSKKHMKKYCDEFTFRWNHRKIKDEDRRDLLLSLVVGKRLTYKQPIKGGDKAAPSEQVI